VENQSKPTLAELLNDETTYRLMDEIRELVESESAAIDAARLASDAVLAARQESEEEEVKLALHQPCDVKSARARYRAAEEVIATHEQTYRALGRAIAKKKSELEARRREVHAELRIAAAREFRVYGQEFLDAIVEAGAAAHRMTRFVAMLDARNIPHAPNIAFRWTQDLTGSYDCGGAIIDGALGLLLASARAQGYTVPSAGDHRFSPSCAPAEDQATVAAVAAVTADRESRKPIISKLLDFAENLLDRG
jgi:hypothetical protein